MDNERISLIPGCARADFLESLLWQISEEERTALLQGSGDLRINQYNRATMVRMLKMGEELRAVSCIAGSRTYEAAEDEPIDLKSAKALHDQLQTYLNCYMADQPQAHKWIILACLFSSFVAREPMHPQEMAKWIKAEDVYACPALEDTEDSLCRWCACWKGRDSRL